MPLRSLIKEIVGFKNALSQKVKVKPSVYITAKELPALKN